MLLLVNICTHAFGWLIALKQLRLIHCEKTIYFFCNICSDPTKWAASAEKGWREMFVFNHSNYNIYCIKRNYFHNCNVAVADAKSFVSLVLIFVEEI